MGNNSYFLTVRLCWWGTEVLLETGEQLYLHEVMSLGRTSDQVLFVALQRGRPLYQTASLTSPNVAVMYGLLSWISPVPGVKIASPITTPPLVNPPMYAGPAPAYTRPAPPNPPGYMGEIKCPSCTTLNGPDSLFCRRCGTKIR